MGKRRTSPEEDETSSAPGTSAKRARRSSDNDTPLFPRVKQESKDNRTAHETDFVADSEEEAQELSTEESQKLVHFEHTRDDEAIEKDETEKVRVLLEMKRKVQGGVAENGIIESIEMHNFMCHKYLTFSFGPQINFIIGHNGSGKSAVLSAITVALGGKAIATGRGNGLKSFIRESASIAEVTISLKNQGAEAFKPKEYGKSIVITRRFTKEGASSWKIKSKDGRVISTKKDELAAICDHMNLQVDNPMTILTQDAARQFLSASRPEDKYQFFLRGTQLSHLSDEYDICLENITQTTKILSQKKAAMPDLRNELKEARTRYAEATKAREQKQKVDDLKKELAWAHVRAKEEEMTAKIEEHANALKRLPKIESSLTAAKSQFEKATQEVTELDAQYRSFGEIQTLTEEKAVVQSQIRANRVKIAEYNGDLRTMDDNKRALDTSISGLQRQIEEEKIRMAAHTQAQHEEVERKLGEAREIVANAKSELTNLQQEKARLIQSVKDLGEKGRSHEAHSKELAQKIQECQQMISRCEQQEKDSLLPYGSNIKQVLARIEQMRWYGDKPLGPLGIHVKAKDPSTWGALISSQLGQQLTSFAITDNRDRAQLKRLLTESKNPHVHIIYYEKDMFDFSHGEPPTHILTVLRALEISDPYVQRILINIGNIERQILANSRREAQDIMTSLRTGGNAWTLDEFQVRVFPEGGVSSTVLNMRRHNDSTSFLLTGRDTASEILHYNQLKESYESEYRTEVQAMNGLRVQIAEIRMEISRVEQAEKDAANAFRLANVSLSNLQQEASDDLPAGLAGFEEALEEAQKEKEVILSQFKDVCAKKAEVDDAQRPLMESLAELKTRIEEFEGKRSEIGKGLETAVTRRLDAQKNMKHYESKIAGENQKIQDLASVVNLVKLEFRNWTADAEKYCPRVENPRRVQEIQRLLASATKALEERRKKDGASVEDMAMELNKATERVETAERELKQIATLNKALKSSLTIRLSRWQEFRRHIALRCKVVFQYHLSHRGYFGKVLFNHDAGTLTLKVQTDDQSATQGHRDKDPRSLSGGEKSFSTICLLLALWESIGCPLRCLDEFDVFMDAVNRRISMKMMIETANSSDKKQYILITPQDMSHVRLGPTVRVHRMTDPERGNGILAFNG